MACLRGLGLVSAGAKCNSIMMFKSQHGCVFSQVIAMISLSIGINSSNGITHPGGPAGHVSGFTVCLGKVLLLLWELSRCRLLRTFQKPLLLLLHLSSHMKHIKTGWCLPYSHSKQWQIPQWSYVPVHAKSSPNYFITQSHLEIFEEELKFHQHVSFKKETLDNAVVMNTLPK